jgi:hypothetical protein
MDGSKLLLTWLDRELAENGDHRHEFLHVNDIRYFSSNNS